MEAAFEGVINEWIEDVIPMDKITSALSEAYLETLSTPKINRVLEAFRYFPPKKTIAVIIGQDPYPSPGDAHGLCFSSRSKVVPDSLRNIFKCLANYNLAAKSSLQSADLRPWASQGILMLNMYLTTIEKKPKSHTHIWKHITAEIVGNLCAQVTTKIYFMLWGSEARSLKTIIPPNHDVFEWTHPSPMVDNKLKPELKFMNCPHFDELKDMIVWDTMRDCIAFVDGACFHNGKPDSRSSFAAILYGGHFRSEIVICGEVCPYEYIFTKSSKLLSQSQTAVRPSNNRGELLAIIYALLAILRAKVLGSVEIITDSLISAKTITEWYDKKANKNDFKNLDLVETAHYLYKTLQSKCASVTITHMRSHQRAPPSTASDREKQLHAGNKRVDEVAVGVLKKNTNYSIQISHHAPHSVIQLSQ